MTWSAVRKEISRDSESAELFLNPKGLVAANEKPCEGFKAFAAGIEDRCVEMPATTELQQVGRYDHLARVPTWMPDQVRHYSAPQVDIHHSSPLLRIAAL